MKNLLKPIARSVLIPLGLTAAASATDADIQKKLDLVCASRYINFASSCLAKRTKLIINFKRRNG